MTEQAGESAPDRATQRWGDALRAAALIAVDPHGLGGVSLQSPHGPVRDQWLAELRAMLPQGTPVCRVPAHIRDDRLLGGLDLAATLQAGRPVSQTGLLAHADGGLLLLAMAERLSDAVAARIGAALDSGQLAVAREGLQETRQARFGVIALDEGLRDPGQEEYPPQRLLERLAFRVDLTPLTASGIGLSVTGDGLGSEALVGADGEAARAIEQARARLAQVQTDDETLEALCATAAALGVESMRGPILALRAARAAAALDGRTRVGAEDAELAARLVLAPRATRLPPEQGEPAPPEAPQDAQPPAPPPDDASATPPETPPEAPSEQAVDSDAPDPPPDPIDTPKPTEPLSDTPLQDQVMEAARAAIPADLLAQLLPGAASSGPARGGGRKGAQREGRLRGRPAGARPGHPRDGGRLALIDTLRAAAPWQTLRRAQRAAALTAAGDTPPTASPRVLEIRASDLRMARLRERRETTTIFAVDASGSAALHRLAETKGAVEMLLAECYVRRDRVAVVSFRGRAAEVLLAPTRSLARAKRSLAGLPGGGGTPLAAGIDAVAELADATARRGGNPVIVLLTDGRANVTRSGAGGRAQADAEARIAARRLRLAGHASMLIDTSPQPQALARGLANEMGATYLALPHADATGLSRAVQRATEGATTGASRGH
jgi:magnesium chelatase subunit D